MNLEPCPAFPDGDAQQCNECFRDIPVGELAARGKPRGWVHAACAPGARTNTSGPRTPANGRGEAVADAMDRLRNPCGYDAEQASAPRAQKPSTPEAVADELERLIAEGS